MTHGSGNLLTRIHSVSGFVSCSASVRLEPAKNRRQVAVLHGWSDSWVVHAGLDAPWAFIGVGPTAS